MTDNGHHGPQQQVDDVERQPEHHAHDDERWSQWPPYIDVACDHCGLGGHWAATTLGGPCAYCDGRIVAVEPESP